jgi:hypothetical protein
MTRGRMLLMRPGVEQPGVEQPGVEQPGVKQPGVEYVQGSNAEGQMLSIEFYNIGPP